jgi:hypothetical protein
LFIIWRSISIQKFMVQCWLVQLLHSPQDFDVRHFFMFEATVLQSMASRLPSIAHTIKCYKTLLTRSKDIRGHAKMDRRKNRLSRRRLWTSETSVYFNKTTGRYIPEGYHVRYSLSLTLLLYPDVSAGRTAREHWWMSQELSPAGIITTTTTMALHANASPGGWTMGPLVASVLRRKSHLINMISQSIVDQLPLTFWETGISTPER